MHVVHFLLYFLIIKSIIHQSVQSSPFDAITNLFSAASNFSQESIKPAIDDDKHMNIILQTANRLTRSPSISNLMKREAKQALPVCNDEKLMIFLAEIQVTNPESIINLATAGEPPIVCKRITEALLGIEEYLKTCTLPTERDLYLQLMKGVAQFVDVMCDRETDLKKEFTNCFPCLVLLHSDFENCYGPADWTEDIKKNDICCAYREIVDCYFSKTAAVCGKCAARTMKKLVVTIINVIIPVRCTLLLEPCAGNASPGCAIQVNQVLVNIVSILTTIQILNYVLA